MNKALEYLIKTLICDMSVFICIIHVLLLTDLTKAQRTQYTLKQYSHHLYNINVTVGEMAFLVCSLILQWCVD